LEIRPTKLIRGQGLAKMTAKTSLVALEDMREEGHVNSLSISLEQFDWYSDIIFYLMNLSCLTNFTKTQRRSLQLWAARYCFVQGWVGMEES
jgi:hypothetical protein